MLKNPQPICLLLKTAGRTAGGLILLCLSVFGHAQEPESEPDAQEQAAAGMAQDRTTVAASPASERLAKQARQLLAGAAEAPATVWLEVAGGQVLGFWQADTSGTPVGAVLMLHAEGHSPRWPATLLNMHHNLPKFGWSTLSVELPPPAPKLVPPRLRLGQASPATPADAARETPEENADAQPVDDETAEEPTQVADAVPADVPPEPAMTTEEVEQLTVDTIAAAIDFLQQRGQQNVVLLGEGLGAEQAASYLAAMGEAAKINALVMLDPQPAGIAAREALMGHPAVSTLDLITSADFDDRARARERRQLSKKMRYQNYVLRRILPPTRHTDSGRENEISKAVRGFIARHAAGTEVAAPRR